MLYTAGKIDDGIANRVYNLGLHRSTLYDTATPSVSICLMPTEQVYPIHTLFLASPVSDCSAYRQ